MIPKIIHYVWVGGKQKPKEVLKCIETWKRKMPDYEIKEWNENNFDVNSHPYVKEAYKQKKWAFVSDYIRMYAIYNDGGIYMDTDVNALERLDPLLNNKVFVGFESNIYPFTAVFGAEKNDEFIKEILDYYNHAETKYTHDYTNTIIVTKILTEKYGCKLGNKEQLLKGRVKVYPKEILCEPSLKSKTIHIGAASWIDSKSIFKKFESFLRKKATNKPMIVVYKIFDYILFIPKRKYGSKIKNIGKNKEK